MSTLKTKHKIIAAVEADLLKQVRASGGMSRVELARQLKLAPSTAGIYVDRLIKEGFLFESCKAERDFGRPPTLLALNPEGGRFIGVDMEARNIMAVAVDFSQKPLKNVHTTLRASDSIDQILVKIEQAIEEVMAADDRTVLGIGLGLPGLIDPVKGLAVHYEHIKGWKNIALGKRLMDRFKVPVYLENNIRSMALAELWFGAGRGVDNFICLGVRTGIAAGVVASGHLHYGSNYQAGEVGKCPCPTSAASAKARGGGAGSTRMLEEIASVPAILGAIAEGMKRGEKTCLEKPPTTIDELVPAVQEQDPLVSRVLDQAAESQAWAISGMNFLFNPAKIILAGPLTALGDSYIQMLTSKTLKLLPEGYQSPPVIVDSTLGKFNGALGAAALALHQWKPAR
jgi:N-acetylglucosamine repressor